ncbi:MAG: glycosyltransferase [Desulfomicrobium escambiense]|nr:glycosyltransferase [Desulfomicrobium escambiense]
MLFAGGCAPRKGLHHALAAWSGRPHRGTVAADRRRVRAGPRARRLSHWLAHPSVECLGHRTDMPELMRDADVLVLPSVEEGRALVTYEARGSGCVLLVSDAAGAVCRHDDDALVHAAGDVETLSRQMTALHEDRALLDRLRAASLAGAPGITGRRAGRRAVCWRSTPRDARRGAGAARPGRRHGDAAGVGSA